MYCGSGVTACHNLLAMEHAGLTRREAVSGLVVGMVAAIPAARGNGTGEVELDEVEEAEVRALVNLP